MAAQAQSQPAIADSVLTLQQCVDIAIKNNIDVKNSETAMERDRVYWNQARENLLPTLNASGSYGITYGRGSTTSGTTISAAESKSLSLGANSSLILSNGLSLINSIKQNSLAYQAGKMDFQQVKDQTTLNVIALYFTALSAEDQLTQAHLQFDGSKGTFDREKILNDAGNVAPADFYTIKGTHESDQINVYNAETALLTAKFNLFEAMNVPFNKDTRLARLRADQQPAAYDKNADDIYASALSDLPMVKATDFRVQAAHKELAAARGKYYPTLSLGGTIQSGYYSNSGQTADPFSSQLRDNKLYGPSLSLSIPILNYFQTRNNVKLAKLDLKAAEDNNSYVKIQLKQQVNQAYANMQSAYNRFQVLLGQVDTYQSAFNAQKAKFDAGVITSDLFIIAKNNLDGANVNLINAHYDYLIRTKILDYYQGKMTAFQ